ncbi:tetratricopeptide repeat protein [Streptomyces sp. BPTC-684]|uniref:tetratricopeptide repeat protein n=1 Tax=Streptomyces sp. BPTC-684 TaxID=3043734 RepID=UPI0024B04EE3|nr:tetratricopeptide repeat protein [Streptomyces sp. BPTC-684]WHM37992.1 tetratricopeptide repeat protein [Streptomyces sp. BPTC-684]
MATGDHAVLAEHATVLPAEAFAEAECPVGVVNLPFRTDMFVGRERELALLDEALETAGGVVVHAVHGLGGIGKSTLAAHWAARRARGHNPVWWITAETPADLDAGLAALAIALQPALAGLLPQEALRERAVQWLATHEGWLVVLDNVTEPDDVRPLLGRVASGRWLITSRRADDWYGIARPVALDVLLPGEAVELFTRIVTHGGPRDVEGVDQLCAEIGNLPLAVELAAAYCARTGTRPGEYLELLAHYPADMYAEGRRAVARTWRVTLDRLVAEDPLTGAVLRVLAWYAPDGIPRSLLDGLGSPVGVRRALGALAAHSMVTLGSDGSVSVHRLVQAVARTPEAGDPYRQAEAVSEAMAMAVRILAGTVPGAAPEPEMWVKWRPLLPHVEALAEHVSRRFEESDREFASLLRDLQSVLNSQRVAATAMRRLSERAGQEENLWGQEFPAWQLQAGHLRMLITHFERSLAHWVRVFGEDHPKTLRVRNDLAYAHRAAGDLGKAIPLYEQTLAARERVLGADHPDTMTSRNNLAGAYRTVGDLDRALPLFERTLVARVRVHGDDHPQTLVARSNLAGACRAVGDLERAMALSERTYADRLRLMGEDHPDTLAALANLATAHRAAGDPARAAALYERVLAGFNRVRGADHPDTRFVRINLTIARRAL